MATPLINFDALPGEFIDALDMLFDHVRRHEQHTKNIAASRQEWVHHVAGTLHDLEQHYFGNVCDIRTRMIHANDMIDAVLGIRKQPYDYNNPDSEDSLEESDDGYEEGEYAQDPEDDDEIEDDDEEKEVGYTYD